MATFPWLLLLLWLSTVVLGQDASASISASISSASITASQAASSASVVVSSASAIASSASDALSSASSLLSISNTIGASSALSSASSLSSVASSVSSIGSSLSSIASSASSVLASLSTALSTSLTQPTSTAGTLSTTTLSTANSVATSSAISSTSESATRSTSTSSLSSTSTRSERSVTSTDTPSPTVAPSTSTSQTPEVFTSTSSSVSFSLDTSTSISVAQTTSNGAVVDTTLTIMVTKSTPATTLVDVSPYTSTPLPPAAGTPVAGNTSTDKGGGDGGGSGSSLSSGAKAGIGAGIGAAVVIAAAFGGWYSWYMRRRRVRNSIHDSDHYPPSSIPSMSGMAGGGMYRPKSDNLSTSSSPPMGTQSPGRGSTASSPPRTSHQFTAPLSKTQSWGSASPSYGAGVVPVAGLGYMDDTVHEVPEGNQIAHRNSNSRRHMRTFSANSQDMQPIYHQRDMSHGSQNYQRPEMGPDGFWYNTPFSDEHAISSTSPPQNYADVAYPVGETEPQRPRKNSDRIPVRAGLLQQRQSLPSPSQNF